ncbi:IS21-like element helper ATPase IstB [Hydrogenimonas thermophila]|uniref:DNA replication protein DnaC n=1 Tax=Hydrogenimonas thermophila TaxID=223786 RepID=A0A1I5QAP7_9BACT|nr:IS21-like element helper ATPase IstB [Hydrogenimonas thermophila]SFP43070.1 DNA replication protein DnaC [Hydrogenimonas thermophila]
MSNNIASINEQIQAYATLFKLPAIKNSFSSLADEAAKKNLSYTQFLLKLFEYEYETKIQRAKEITLKMAGFPKVKTLQDFDFSSSPVDRNIINELSTLRFIENAQNVLLIGPSGVGKTHLAIALGYLATQARIKTKFITAQDLLLQLEIAQQTNRLQHYFKKVINTTKLLIIDEFGYIKLDANQANLFFQVINKRYETGSIIITSNLSFTKFKEVLNNDEALTTAILDRLIHHSHILNIQGESYRLKQKREAGVLLGLDKSL